jgi:hypothetical protein
MRRNQMVTLEEITNEVIAKRQPLLHQVDPLILIARDPSIAREIRRKARKAKRRGLLLEPPDPTQPL